MAKIDPYYLAFDSSQPCQYYQPSNAINSTEVDYSGQAQQYQNTLTLGITFFNLSSIFIGRVFLLILRVGSSLTALIYYSIFQILIDNNKITLSQLSYIWM
ncbi:unnamed protein product [Adineta steineri]|uniref:Uncharacterized protein n=1 Tax=Adineta steineri TaxID=433720 RepID=A0A819ZZ62_9BILA|nr:unnamed protein product [Adineta steineri]